jgi:hypothetical protein
VTPEAFENYLKGIHAWEEARPGWWEEAVASFEKAIELDPNYALAYGKLAEAHAASAVTGKRPPEEAYARARDIALKARPTEDFDPPSVSIPVMPLCTIVGLDT